MKNIVILLIILISNSAKADFNSALNAYSTGDYASAHKQFTVMAADGEKRSQFNLGVMYFNGQHVAKDIDQAYAWLKLATESETSKEVERKTFEHVKSLIPDLNKAEQKYLNLVEKYSTQVLINRLYPEFITPENGNAFEAEPVKIVAPKYPKKAALKRIQGWTRFVFDLDKLGVPRNIQLLESFPGTLFTNSSRRAIEQWKFKPATNAKGVAIQQPNLTYTMQYQMAGQGDIALKKGVFEEHLKNALEGDYNEQFVVGYLLKKLPSIQNNSNPNEWFLKAAIQGHSAAQFELGRSLVFGQGCKLDKAKGVEWLTRSAHSGESEAKQLLATVASRVNTLESHQKAVNYLKGVKELSASTQLNYAWMLAISPFKEIANPKKSLEIVDNMSSKTFNDDITLYEIRAAAYAALGDFEEAVDLQEEALEEAEDRDADLDSIKSHLASYQKKEKWF